MHCMIEAIIWDKYTGGQVHINAWFDCYEDNRWLPRVDLQFHTLKPTSSFLSHPTMSEYESAWTMCVPSSLDLNLRTLIFFYYNDQ